MYDQEDLFYGPLVLRGPENISGTGPGLPLNGPQYWYNLNNI